MEQLTYAGVFEAVQIRKSGYPFRLPHRRFANRYRCLAYKETGWVGLGTRQGDYKGMCSALLRCVNQVRRRESFCREGVGGAGGWDGGRGGGGGNFAYRDIAV